MIAVAVALSCVAIYHYNPKINGSEIVELMTLENLHTVEFTKAYLIPGNVIEQSVLDDDQIGMLISLLEESEFKNISSEMIDYEDKDMYIFGVKNADDGLYFRLESYGGEFVVITVAPLYQDTPTTDSLYIENENWKNALEAIIR